MEDMSSYTEDMGYGDTIDNTSMWGIYGGDSVGGGND